MHIRFFNLPHKVSIKKNTPNKYTLKDFKKSKELYEYNILSNNNNN